jgi:hypothetical protein
MPPVIPEAFLFAVEFRNDFNQTHNILVKFS